MGARIASTMAVIRLTFTNSSSHPGIDSAQTNTELEN